MNKKLSASLQQLKAKVVEFTERVEEDGKEKVKLTTELTSAEEALVDAVGQGELLSTAKAGLEANLADTKAKLSTKTHECEQAVSEIRTVAFQAQAFEAHLSKSADLLLKAGPADGVAEGKGGSLPEDMVEQDEDEDEDGDSDEEPEGFVTAAGDGADGATDGVDFAIAKLRQQLGTTQKHVFRVAAESEAAALRADAAKVAATAAAETKAELTDKVRGLESALATETATLQSTQLELTAMTDRESEATRDLTETKAKLEAVEGELATCASRLADCEEKLADNLSRLAHMTSEYDETDTALKATMELLGQKKAALEEMTAEAQEGQAALEELSAQLNEIKSTAISALGVLGSTRTELESTKQRLVLSEAKGIELVREVAELTETLGKANAELTVFAQTKDDLAESQGYVRTLTKQVDDAVEAKEMSEVDCKLATLEREKAAAVAESKDQLLVTCMEKLNRTESQLETASKRLKDAKAEIETLTDRIARLKQEGEGSQTVNAALTTTLESTKTELATCQADLEKAEGEIKLQAQKLLVEMECGVKLTTLLAKSENTINDSKVQIEALTTRVASSESETTRLTGDVGDLATMRVESKSAVESAESARLALSTATLEKEQLADQLASVTARKDEFERKLTAAERLVSSISVEKLKIAAELKKLTARMEKTEGERSQIESGLSATTARLDAIEHAPGDLTVAQSKVVELEAEIQALKTRLDDANRKKTAAERLVSSVSVEKLKLKAKLERLETTSPTGGADTGRADRLRERARDRTELIHTVFSKLGCPARKCEVTRADNSVSLGVEVSANSAGQIKITNVEQGSPADGLVREHDAIISVNGQFLLDSTYDDLVGALLEAGTYVFLAVARDQDILALVS